MKKVLITGAGGFVGSYLIKEFKKYNYEVVACDINKKDSIDKDIIYYDMDILDRKRIDEVITECKPDYIINLAAISSVGLSWKMPDKTMEVNIIGTLNILEAVHNNLQECKIMLIGSSEEYIQKEEMLKEEDLLNANNPYGISKIAAENIARMYANQYNMSIICTRSFNHTGIGQTDNFVIPSFCKQVAGIEKQGIDGKIFVGNLSAYRDISDVKDVVKTYRILLEKHTNGFEVFNVGFGEAYQMKEILEKIISFSKQNIEIVVDPSRVRAVDTPYICADTTKIDKILQKDIERNTLDKVLKEMFEYYKQN